MYGSRYVSRRKSFLKIAWEGRTSDIHHPTSTQELKQDCELEANLGYSVRPCLKKTTKPYSDGKDTPFMHREKSLGG